MTISSQGIKTIVDRCAGTLPARGKCTVSGIFDPSALGSYHPSVTLRYKEGKAVVKTMSTTVSDVVVSSSMAEGLPANVRMGTTYDVIFSFKDDNKVLPATAVRHGRPKAGADSPR